MIKYTPASECTLSLFRTPFEEQLDANNRWVKMAAVVPWDACLIYRIYISRDRVKTGNFGSNKKQNK